MCGCLYGGSREEFFMLGGKVKNCWSCYNMIPVAGGSFNNFSDSDRSEYFAPSSNESESEGVKLFVGQVI